ncbi:hypothetical protein AGMMS50276_00430 [Synergistales bacterium]|nr:hypothetical protein AGMMS50276_00430 [Synergistales bacterium]
MKKVIRTAQISEHNATQKVECEKVERSAESRVLKTFIIEQQKRYKNTTGAFRLGTEEA